MVFTDPAPKPPMTGICDPGDYLLTTGDSVELVARAKATFDAQNRFILTFPGWEPLESDMTASDLKDLGEEQFLLWWQCIKPPKETNPRKQAPVPDAKQKRKQKRSKR